jgi:hypothetical protein
MPASLMLTIEIDTGCLVVRKSQTYDLLKPDSSAISIASQ